MVDIVRFCRSRKDGRRCTRHLDHLGLHRHRAVMWADATADPPTCPGSGAVAAPAEPSPDGYPHGRGLCRECSRLIPIETGRLAAHDSSDAGESPEETMWRREWLNTHGW